MNKFYFSGCTIVKNEERQIGDFLRSLDGIADEIVLVDTGSTDATVEIIKKFISKPHVSDIKLYLYSGIGGFHYGLAKDYSIEKATKDYIIILDADERLSEGFKRNIHSYLEREQPVVASVIRKDELLPHLIDCPERIILRGSGIRYGGDIETRVHEQLQKNIPSKHFPEIIWHQQRENHYIIRPQRILFQLELQIDRTQKTKSFLGHFIRGIWYFFYRFKKLYVTRNLYKDGKLGFKYCFMRALDAFLIQFFVGLKPSASTRSKLLNRTTNITPDANSD